MSQDATIIILHSFITIYQWISGNSFNMDI